MKTALSVFLAAMTLLLTGCGSIGARWSGAREPYAGVKLATDTIRNYHTEGELIAIVDIPLSAIADTFLLPYDLSGDESEKDEVSVLQPSEPAGPLGAQLGYQP